MKRLELRLSVLLRIKPIFPHLSVLSANDTAKDRELWKTKAANVLEEQGTQREREREIQIGLGQFHILALKIADVHCRDACA